MPAGTIAPLASARPARRAKAIAAITPGNGLAFPDFTLYRFASLRIKRLDDPMAPAWRLFGRGIVSLLIVAWIREPAGQPPG